ncbi:OmpA family protein [Burkholderiaceae bacterium UC74_6]
MSPLLSLLVLSACSAPPRPPMVDQSSRHPANAGSAVELQICRSVLQSMRIQTAESERSAATSSAILANLITQQRALAQLRTLGASAAQETSGNTVYTVRFDFGSSHVRLSEQAGQSLIERARPAPLILLRGRTDGSIASAAESRVARARAAAVRDYLIAAGVDPARIRATYQPVGDPVADNGNAAGRALNRRVEIEIYRELPIALDAGAGAP